jgi:hypothetical protein
MIKSEKRRTSEKSVVDLQEDYKGKKKLLHAVMRNKMKPKTNYSEYYTKMEKWFAHKHLPQDMDETLHGVVKWTD